MGMFDFFKSKSKKISQENFTEKKIENDLPKSTHTMEKKNIQGKNCIIIKVNIENEIIPILGAISEHNPETIEYISYRDRNLVVADGQFTYTTTIDSFVKEITFMAQYLDKNGMKDANFEKSLDILAKNHINKNGRMIDNDFYGLVDRAVMLKSSIAIYYKQNPNKIQLENMWLQILKNSIPKIKNSFFTTKYDLSNPSQPRPYLEKLI